MLFERNNPYTTDSLLAKADIQELITFGRFSRDNSLWDSMRTCFADNAHINISWFSGSGEEFVESSKAMHRYAPHQIYNSQIWINKERAIAIMQATIQTRLTIKDVQMQLNSDAKIIYSLTKATDTWYIQHMECVYEKDSLTPVFPASIKLSQNDFEPYRSSYACLSYCLNYLGYEVNHDLQGIDRPDALNVFYQHLDHWLTYRSHSLK
jgi:hypothetical protein